MKNFSKLFKSIVPKTESTKLLLGFVAIIACFIVWNQCGFKGTNTIKPKKPKDSIVYVNVEKIIHDTPSDYGKKQKPNIKYISKTDSFYYEPIIWGKLKLKSKYNVPEYKPPIDEIPITYLYDFKMYKDSLSISYVDQHKGLIQKNYFLSFDQYKWYYFRGSTLTAHEPINPFRHLIPTLTFEGNLIYLYSPFGNSKIASEFSMKTDKLSVFVMPSYSPNENIPFNCYFGVKYTFFKK